MPGRTPAAAYRSFIEPLEAAIACLGPAKLVVSPGGRADTSREHSWSLNEPGTGMAFPGGYLFRAQMSYRFVEHEEGWRVTTLSYMYSLHLLGEECWAMHWHPNGMSSETGPHMHIGIPGVYDRKAHLASPRMTLETAVEWVIAAGIQPAREDWREILCASQAVHVEHRSWGGTTT